MLTLDRRFLASDGGSCHRGFTIVRDSNGRLGSVSIIKNLEVGWPAFTTDSTKFVMHASSCQMSGVCSSSLPSGAWHFFTGTNAPTLSLKAVLDTSSWPLPGLGVGLFCLWGPFSRDSLSICALYHLVRMHLSLTSKLCTGSDSDVESCEESIA